MCSGETGRTTAHIIHALDDRYYNLEQSHGNEGARLAAESQTAAINRVNTYVYWSIKTRTVIATCRKEDIIARASRSAI